ncbi:hypothetical protein C8Q80DRAFT_1095185 [Daedaleopsis nitida]|nr:hypothetical protein C8Q80DRAFT_1095185 [Daedaleopsis nitida]
MFYHWQGELEHRHSKRWYARTNRIHFEFQIAQKQRRRAILEGLRRRDPTFTPRWEQKLEKANAKREVSEAIDRGLAHATNRRQGDTTAPISPTTHYEDFLPRLREHLLSRFLPGTRVADFSEEHHDGLIVYDDRLLRHKVLRVNYTTYDMRRDQDSINPRTHPDVMLLADDPGTDSHPYWYARIIDLFHIKVRYTGPGSDRNMWKWQRVDFAWVRWLKYETDYKSGFAHRRLPRVRFLNAYDAEDDAPVGFINPDDIVRAAYLMPAFALGRTDEYLGPSKLARRMRSDDDDDDYCAFYVCM